MKSSEYSLNTKTILIEEDEARFNLDNLNLLTLTKEAFSLQSSGLVKTSPRDVLEGTTGSQLLGTMPGLIMEGPYAGFGLKTVSVELDSKKRFGNSSHQGYLILYGSDYSNENFIIDAAPITELRTAAASALATMLLCSKKEPRVSIIGTGLQAKSHMLVLNRYNGFSKFVVYARDEASKRNFEEWVSGNMDVSCVVSTNLPYTLDGANIICTTTAATEAFLTSQILPAECHINAIGASTPKFQELSVDVADGSCIFVDSVEACMSSSFFVSSAIKQNRIDRKNLIEIGSLVKRDVNFESNGTRTIFNSVGIIVQDLVFGRAISKMRLRS